MTASVLSGFCALADPVAVTETDILKTIDRKPLEMNFFSVPPALDGGLGVLFATSEGLIEADPRFQRAKFLLKEPVTAAAWDAGLRTWVAGAPLGVWREDLGWVRPSGPRIDPEDDVGISAMSAGRPGIVLMSRTDLWLMKPGRADAPVHLLTDSHGLFGKPAVSDEEAAAIGLWSLHRIRLTDPAGGRIDIPLPAAARADIPLGVSYVGRSLAVIFQNTGLYILSPHDRAFPEPIAPPKLGESHLEMGFPEGWADYAVDADELYLLSGDARLYHLSVGRPLRRISKWPDLGRPYRLALLPGRRVLLVPTRGNYVLHADPSRSDLPIKINFLSTAAGEILLRRGLEPDVFRYRSKSERIHAALGWAMVAAGVLVFAGWSVKNGVPGLHRLHPNAAVFDDRLMKLRRDQLSLFQSFQRTEKELRRMKSAFESGGSQDETFRKNYEDRMRVMSENHASLVDNLRRLARNAVEESLRVKPDSVPARHSGEPASVLTRILRRQTRGWERQFARIAREIEKVLKDHANSL